MPDVIGPGSRAPGSGLGAAVVEVIAETAGCRVVWTTDLLPDEIEPAVAAMQAEAIVAMPCELEEAARAGSPFAREAMYTPRLA